MVGGLQIATADSKYIVIEDAAIAAFQADLRSRVLRDGDAGYDDARKVWNGMIDRKPALIARCAGVADVMSAVNFARVNDLRLSVRGGGHNITGNAVCDGGLIARNRGAVRQIFYGRSKKISPSDIARSIDLYLNRKPALPIANEGIES